MRRRARIFLLGILGVLLVCVICGALLVARARVRLATVSIDSSVSRSIWFSRVSVFDGEALLRDRDVLVVGDSIAVVASAGQRQPPAEALKIDGVGRTLLPGLIDSHVHLTTVGGPPWKFYLPNVQANAGALLYAGITSALIAQSGRDEEKLVARATSGQALAPRLFLAGPGLTAPGGHPIPFIRALLPWPLSTLVISQQATAKDPQQANTTVARIKERSHPPLLKIYYDALPKGSPQLSEETLRAAIEAAKQNGMRSVVHIGNSADMVRAAEAGAALLMHAPSSDRLSEAQLARLAALKVPFVTTMGVMQGLEDLSRSGGSPLEREIIEPAVLRAFAEPPPGWQIKGFEGMERDLPQVTARLRDNVRRLVLAGVPFFVGTDTGVFGVIPGAAMHRELFELYRLGLPPLIVLRAATSAPAAFLDPTNGFGRIAAGQRADLLLVRGDPSTDPGALSNIEEVFLAGARLKRTAVDR